MQLGGDAERVITPDGHNSRKTQSSKIIDAPLNVGRLFIRIGPRRAENGAAAGNDAVGFQNRQRASFHFHQPAPTLKQTDALSAGIGDLANHRPDDSIQAGTIAAAG